MKINNNNNGVSFGTFKANFQLGMKEPISREFARKIAQLKKEFAADKLLHVAIYDVFSSQGVINGKHQRIIGASITPASGCHAPNTGCFEFMTSTSSGSKGVKLTTKLRMLAKKLRPKCEPMPIRPTPIVFEQDDFPIYWDV